MNIQQTYTCTPGPMFEVQKNMLRVPPNIPSLDLGLIFCIAITHGKERRKFGGNK